MSAMSNAPLGGGGGDNGGEEGGEEAVVAATIPLPADVISAYCQRTPVVTRTEDTVYMSTEATGWLALEHQKIQYLGVLNLIRKQMKTLESAAIPFMSTLKKNELSLTTFTAEEMKVFGQPGKLRLVSKKAAATAMKEDHMQQFLHHFMVNNMQQRPVKDAEGNPVKDDAGNAVLSDPELTITLGACSDFVAKVVRYAYDSLPKKPPVLTLTRSIKESGGNSRKRKTATAAAAMDIEGGVSQASAAPLAMLHQQLDGGNSMIDGAGDSEGAASALVFASDGGGT